MSGADCWGSPARWGPGRILAATQHCGIPKTHQACWALSRSYQQHNVPATRAVGVWGSEVPAGWRGVPTLQEREGAGEGEEAACHPQGPGVPPCQRYCSFQAAGAAPGSFLPSPTHPGPAGASPGGPHPCSAPGRSRDSWHPRDRVGALLSHHFTVLVFPWCCCAFAGSQLRAMTNLFSKQAQSKREVCANPRGGGGITARGWTGLARRWSSWECPATEQPCRQQPPVWGWAQQRWAGALSTPNFPSLRQSWGAGSVPGQAAACRAGRRGPSALRTPRTMARAGALTRVVLPYGEAAGGRCQGGSTGVCSGQNRASIDLLLLKPELLSGTPQPGCPRVLPGKGCPVCPHQREMGPPKHLAAAMACAGFGWQPGQGAKDSVLPLVPTSSWLPVAHCPPGPPQLTPVLPAVLRAVLSPHGGWQDGAVAPR